MRHMRLNSLKNIAVNNRMKNSKFMLARINSRSLIEFNEIKPGAMFDSDSDNIFYKMTLGMIDDIDNKQLSAASDIYSEWPSISELGYGVFNHNPISYLAYIWNCTENDVFNYLKKYKG